MTSQHTPHQRAASRGGQDQGIHPISAPGIMDVVVRFLREEGAAKGQILLDVPAGEGALAAALDRCGLEFDVRCGDLYPEQFKYPKVPCAAIDLNEPLPYAAASLDVVTCIEGIEHIENPFALVREAYRVLRPGGRFVLSTPNVLSLRSRWQYLLYGAANTFDYMAGTPWHINPVSYIELRFMLEREGFLLTRVETDAMTKRGSWWHHLLGQIVRTRGKSWVRDNDKAKQVRETLLSETLLFGDCLILLAVKPA